MNAPRELPPQLQAAVDAAVAKAPPLTPEQATRIRALLAPTIEAQERRRSA